MNLIKYFTTKNKILENFLNGDFSDRTHQFEGIAEGRSNWWFFFQKQSGHGYDEVAFTSRDCYIANLIKRCRQIS